MKPLTAEQYSRCPEKIIGVGKKQAAICTEMKQCTEEQNISRHTYT